MARNQSINGGGGMAANENNGSVMTSAYLLCVHTTGSTYGVTLLNHNMRALRSRVRAAA